MPPESPNALPSRAATRNLSFAHAWQAEILERPPLIAPARQYVYPQAVEEVERGALLLHVTPPNATPFLATFALGFQAPTLPHGLWACPNPQQLCAVAGGYAFVVNAQQPEQWQQIVYRPVTDIFVALRHRLLLFAGFHAICALGENGLAWETQRLSWEGLRIPHQQPDSDTLEGLGWDLHTDTEVAFSVNLRTGHHTGGAFVSDASSPPATQR